MSNESKIIILNESQKAANAVDKSVASLLKVIDGIETYVTEVDELSELVNVKTVQLQDLEITFENRQNEIKKETATLIAENKVAVSEAVRTANVNRDLDIKADADTAISSLLAARNEVAVPAGTVESLQTELANANHDNQKEIEAAVSKANGISASKLTAALNEAELVNKANTAVDTAALVSANDKVYLLTAQLQEANQQVSEIRASMTEMISKQSAPVINVNGK